MALGCTGECYFCGARCSGEQQCSGGQNHKTSFHRPMAFKGTYETVNGKKCLTKDYCTSDYNLNKSRWNKPTITQTDTDRLMERLNEFNCETEGMNVVLEWTGASDLDIQVMCGCGKWHGYGTEGGSRGLCKCDTCEMERDHDERTAD